MPGAPGRVSPAAEAALGQEPVAQALQGQRVSPASPAPLQRARGEAEEHLARGSAIPRVQGREFARQLVDSSIASPPDRMRGAVMASSGVGRFLPGRPRR